MKTLNPQIDTDVVAAGSGPEMVTREDLPLIRSGLQTLLRINRGDRQRMRRIEDVMGYLLEFEAQLNIQPGKEHKRAA